MNTPAFAQIEPTPWPSGYGDAIAVTRVRPELFSRAFGLSFFEGSDNLDAYEAAAIRRRFRQMPQRGAAAEPRFTRMPVMTS